MGPKLPMKNMCWYRIITLTIENKFTPRSTIDEESEVSTIDEGSEVTHKDEDMVHPSRNSLKKNNITSITIKNVHNNNLKKRKPMPSNYLRPNNERRKKRKTIPSNYSRINNELRKRHLPPLARRKLFNIDTKEYAIIYEYKYSYVLPAKWEQNIQ